MNFAFSPEEEAFRQEVAHFIAREITPEVFSPMGLLDTPARQAFISKMVPKGWLSMGFPAEYGGTGEIMPLARYMLNQELQKAQAPHVGKNLGIIVNCLLLHGSEKLKQQLIPPTLRNEIQWSLAYTEPEAGSDLANLQTRAVLDGDEYVVNGQKRFITSAHFGDYMWTAVRTDPTLPKHKGISILIIDGKAPGMTITPMRMLNGEQTNEVFLDDVRVPKERLMGELNKGWYYVAEALSYERFTLTSSAGLVRRFGKLVNWVKQAKVDGKPLAQDPLARRQIARLSVMVEMAWMLDLRCICMAAKPDYVPSNEAAMNKAWGAIAETELSDVALDLMGPDGYLWRDPEAPLEGDMASAYLMAGHIRVAAAGVDVAKNIIAKRYLGLPAS
ncbi:MAG TPA: acyl-CoA dehydrogenase family protein [Dehalococcoidia bacterium]|nr:acyl-CoA dehydrogenase family protein [Dehalococcoidia bacterium]